MGDLLRKGPQNITEGSSSVMFRPHPNLFRLDKMEETK